MRAGICEKSPRRISSRTICRTICAELAAWLITNRFAEGLELVCKFIVVFAFWDESVNNGLPVKADLQPVHCTDRAKQTMTLTRAEQAADVALSAAFQECIDADLNPLPHRYALTELLADSVMEAVREIAVDKRSQGPAFALQLNSAEVQNIYFADAGRRAAQTLLQQLGVSHALVTTRRQDSCGKD